MDEARLASQIEFVLELDRLKDDQAEVAPEPSKPKEERIYYWGLYRTIEDLRRFHWRSTYWIGFFVVLGLLTIFLAWLFGG